jgi:hypothetical protein
MRPITILTALLISAAVTATAEAATCGAPAKCQALGASAGSALLTGMNAAAGLSTNMPGQAGGLGSTTGSCNANFQTAAGQCGTIKQECKQCGTKAQQQACESKIDSMIAQYQAQAGSCAQNSLDSGKTQTASSTTTGSGNGSMLGTVMGALAGAAIGYMAANQNNSTSSTAVAETGALTSAGLNCAEVDGYRYTACDATLLNYCAYGSTAAASSTAVAGVTTVNGTSSLTPTGAACQAFVGRYCANATSSGTTTTIDNTNFYTIDATGTGLGSSFCTTWTAASYCAVAGRESCPSCLNLSASTSAVCTENPAACLAGNSSATLDAAKTACPTDPMFASVSSTTVVTTASNGPQTMILASVNSEVGAQYGPSLFTITQQAIEGRCAERKLNCP